MRRIAFRKNVFLSEFGFMILFGFEFNDSFCISEGRKALGNQSVEAILHVGLY